MHSTWARVVVFWVDFVCDAEGEEAPASPAAVFASARKATSH